VAKILFIFAYMMRPEPNALLVAQPLLRDPNFARTVVLLVAHDSGGSLGYVLNRPAPVRVQEVTDYFGNIDYPLFIGGPVQRNTLHIVHALGEILPESQPVGKSLYWSGSWKHLRSLLAVRDLPPNTIRFFAGYAGWAPGQLEAEIAHKAWLVFPAKPEYVFSEEPEKLWEKVLLDQGGPYAQLTRYPVDPRLN
jgi:putative transcriptional regulator